MNPLTLTDIDWNSLWQQEKNKKSWKSKTARDWDNKATSFAKRTSTSIYTDKFLELLKPEPHWSVLDAGCGPGTLSLPMSPRVEKITALDFSRKMLEILNHEAETRNLDNIKTIHASWEDDWQKLQIPVHDVALASRSLAVQDLRAGLRKLSRQARKKVVITDRVKHGPFDPDAFAAIGRPLRTGPDYIYTVNLLYQMGYLPTVDYIHLEESLRYSSIQEAMDGYTWMFRDIEPSEEKRLREYVESIITCANDGTISVHRRHVPTWAYITWEV